MVNIRISPNPVKDYLYVFAEDKVLDIQINNIQGKTVFSKALNTDFATLNISNLPNNLYFVVIRTSTQMVTKKVLIY